MNRINDLYTLANNPYMVDVGWDMEEIRWSYPGDNSESDFFHATYIENLPEIIENGIDPYYKKNWDVSQEGYSYFTKIPIGAVGWAIDYMYEYKEDEYEGPDEPIIPLVLLRIPEEYMEYMEYDHEGTLNATPITNNYKTTEYIPPEDIDILTKEGWIPLLNY